MNIAHITVKGIYRGQKKLAESLVNGRVLLIEGSTGFVKVRNGCVRLPPARRNNALQMMRTEG